MKSNDILVSSLPAPYLYIDYFVREGKWEMMIHSHDYFQAMFVETGVLEMISDNHSYQITRGQLCIIPPGTPHWLFTKQGYAELGFAVTVGDTSHPLVNLLTSRIKKISIENHPEMLNLIRDVRVEMNKLTSLAKLKIINTLQTISINSFENNKDLDSSFGERLLNILNSSFGGKLSLKDVSSQLLLSQSQTEKLCFDEFGCGAIELYNQARINKACTLLLNSNHSLDYISSALSFCDQAHFSKFFKLKTGITPSKYRKTVFSTY